MDCQLCSQQHQMLKKTYGMSLAALIDVSPGVLTSKNQVDRIKDAVLKFLLPLERTATPATCHFLFFDSSLTADEESKRLRQGASDACDCNRKQSCQGYMKGQSCTPPQTFSDLGRQLDELFCDSRKGTSPLPHVTLSSLWRTMDRFHALSSQRSHVLAARGRKLKRVVKGLTNLVVIFSSLARTDNEIVDFCHLSGAPAEPPREAQVGNSTGGPEKEIDCFQSESFVRHLKDHKRRLRTAGFEVQWADMRPEATSDTRVNTSVLDVIRQEWGLAWEECEFPWRGSLVPPIEAWQALGRHPQDACRGQLGWGKKTQAAVSLVQIQRQW